MANALSPLFSGLSRAIIDLKAIANPAIQITSNIFRDVAGANNKLKKASK
jgi:hypothetical protein